MLFVAGTATGWLLHGDRSSQASPAQPSAQAHELRSRQQSALESRSGSHGVTSADTADRKIEPLGPSEAEAQVPTATSGIPTRHGDPGQLFDGGDLSSQHDAATRNTDRSKLHDAYRISCQFGTGVNGQVSEGTFETSGASWQGGIITFDVLDADAGRATMSGTAGATGSPSGNVEVRMAETDAGLSFSSLVPRGDLISTTVFSQRNSLGDYVAVMSTHAVRSGHMASQFYGTCDVR